MGAKPPLPRLAPGYCRQGWSGSLTKRFGRRQRRELRPQELDAHPLFRAGHNNLRMSSHMGCDLLRGPLHQKLQRRCLDLVALGQNDLVGNRRLVEFRHYFAVDVLEAMAGINQQQDPAKLRTPLQIAACEARPAFNVFLRSLRIAVARQIDEHEAPAQLEEDQLLRATGSTGSTSKRTPAGQGIDEAGLADVGSACEGDLRPEARRYLIGLGGGQHEASLLGKEQAPLL